MAARMKDFEKIDSSFKPKADAEVKSGTQETPAKKVEGIGDDTDGSPKVSGQVEKKDYSTPEPAEQRPRRSARLARKIST